MAAGVQVVISCSPIAFGEGIVFLALLSAILILSNASNAWHISTEVVGEVSEGAVVDPGNKTVSFLSSTPANLSFFWTGICKPLTSRLFDEEGGHGRSGEDSPLSRMHDSWPIIDSGKLISSVKKSSKLTDSYCGSLYWHPVLLFWPLSKVLIKIDECLKDDLLSPRPALMFRCNFQDCRPLRACWGGLQQDHYPSERDAYFRSY
jgi:hypothetical protein